VLIEMTHDLSLRDLAEVEAITAVDKVENLPIGVDSQKAEPEIASLLRS
jgi:hypothetical protein